MKDEVWCGPNFMLHPSALILSDSEEPGMVESGWSATRFHRVWLPGLFGAATPESPICFRA
jgi:hypothetical protein